MNARTANTNGLLDTLFPKAQSKPIIVRDAFAGIEQQESPVKMATKMVDRCNKTRPGKSLYENFGCSPNKLDGEKVAPTLTKCGDATYATFHYKWPRPILVSEMQRLASFPDEYKMIGDYKNAKDRIGNSVPPLMMYAISANIRHKLFGGKPLSDRKGMNYPAILEEAWQQHLAPREKNAPTVISTFAGCGGSSLGYSMAGYRELLAVEWEKNAVDTFKLNFPDVPVLHEDIAKVTVEDVLKRTGLKPGELDILDGSPPCQGFSTAGKREFTDDRNQLFKEYVRLLRGLRPKVFVMENVSGMVKGKMKLIFAECLRELKASGYKVSARLLNAMYFHVPQSRQRMIFIGVREDLGIEPSHPKAESTPIVIKRVLPIRHLDYDTKGQFSEMDIDTARKVFPSVTKGNRHHFFADFGQGNRKLKISEVQLFASFPIGMRYVGSDSNAWERIGNSVPPLMMRAIAKHIKQEILKE